MNSARIRKIVMTAMLCALAFVTVALLRIPVVAFLKYDPKDVIITLGGLIWGPLTSLIVSVVVSLIEMVTISDTGIWGCVMNIVSTCAFACTAAFIYKKKRTMGGALIGLVCGILAQVGVMMLWNYLITPIYMGVPRQAVVEMLLPTFLPFNALKASLNAGITFMLYKPLVTALRKTGMVEEHQSGEKVGKKAIGVYILVAMVIVTCVLFVLSFNGII